jgi:DNA polymerase-3 subunit delta'
VKRPRSNPADVAVRHPREAAELIGHDPAERAVADAYRSGRMPHAWLIGGPLGVGKATFAYRIARFVLAYPDHRSVRDSGSLAVDPEHPAAKRIAAQAHPDLLVLQRTENERGTLRTAIAVDDVRRTVRFFGSTPGEGGWRVCIVDSADELNASSANALLKIVEEPPSRSLLLLVSHAPGRLLPTIRSRCRRLTLTTLTADEVACAVANATGRAPDDAELLSAAAAAEGSAGRAVDLLDGDKLALLDKINALLAKLPDVDPRALHTLGDEIAGTDPGVLATFVDAVSAWLSLRLRTLHGTDLARLAQTAEVWEKVGAAARDVEIYNLERKPLVFSVFGLLAETARH